MIKQVKCGPDCPHCNAIALTLAAMLSIIEQTGRAVLDASRCYPGCADCYQIDCDAHELEETSDGDTIVEIYAEDCCCCGKCARVCPHGAIMMKGNDEIVATMESRNISDLCKDAPVNRKRNEGLVNIENKRNNGKFDR